MASVDRRRLYRLMWHMHNVMMALSDEDIISEWLMYGIPDGTESLEQVEDLFSLETDEELAEDFDDMSILFSKLVRSATDDGFRKWIC